MQMPAQRNLYAGIRGKLVKVNAQTKICCDPETLDGVLPPGMSSEFELPFDVTAPEFVEIDGVPYCAKKETDM